MEIAGPLRGELSGIEGLDALAKALAAGLMGLERILGLARRGSTFTVDPCIPGVLARLSDNLALWGGCRRLPVDLVL